MNYKHHGWSNTKGVIAGHEALLRRNESLLAVVHSEYPYTLIVSLLFKEVSQSGIPCNSSELHRADATEEAIADALFEKFHGLFSLSITTQGARDIFIMFNEPVSEGLIESTIESTEPKIDFSLKFVQDPKWQPYFRFV
jgi:Family of unknown function (DUF695)